MKKVILRLLPWIIGLGLIAALVIFVGIPIYSQEEEILYEEPEIYFYEGQEEPFVMENENLTFELDPATSHFTVTDKSTNLVWRSNPENADKDPIAIAANKDLMRSTAIVTYTNSSGSIDLENYTLSIVNRNYNIEQVSDTEIHVKYAIGRIEREYQIPSAIPKERYEAFLDSVKKSTQKKIKSSYSLYEPDKLSKKKNLEETMALYPAIAEQAMYILNSDVKASNKEKLEGYFAEAGYTREDYELDLQWVAASRETGGPVFNVTYIYRLEGNDLVVEVPYEEIRCRGDYPITSVAVLPMFGAVDNAHEGFILLPEGGGALIRYNNGKLAQNPYYSNLYGWNYSTYRNELVNETRSSFPVFGMTNETGSFICIIEGATSYASIQADVSMRLNTYNWVRAKHSVLHFDQYNVSAKTSNLVFMYEKAIPTDTVIHRYRFLDSNSYVDMATTYGDYLRGKEEYAGDTASKDVPVSVELVGAIDKTMVKFGLPVDSVVPTTTFADAEKMLLEMKDAGINNLNVRMSGWANGGITQKVLTKVKVLKELGGKEAMSRLIDTAAKNDVNLYFDGIACFAYDSGLLQGFIPFRDAAKFTTREQALIYPYDPIIYLGDAEWRDEFYLVKPRYAKQNTTNLIQALAEQKAAGIAFRDIGYLVSGDYNPKDTVTRQQVVAMNIESMKEATAAGQKVLIRNGNDYAVPYADLITDMDLLGTKYSILDETIPFYQIALHGMKDYTGEPLNIAGDFATEMLRCAEYGAGLNFTFMQEDAKILQDSFHSTLYGSHYDSWKEEVLTLIGQYQKDMEGLNQQRIVGYEKLSETVSATEYEDGTKVYVNYSDEAYEKNGISVAARSYAVERGE